MHMAGEGMHRGGGEGGCTCILCIPPGYAPASVNESYGPVTYLPEVLSKISSVEFRVKQDRVTHSTGYDKLEVQY
jgi:hypothetical protein